MIDKEPGLRTILRINMRFIAAAVVLFYGWVCWQWASKEMWGFWLIAILAVLFGGVWIIRAIVEVVMLVVRNRKVNVFTDQGGKARADRMARERDLKDRGMIR